MKKIFKVGGMKCKSCKLLLENKVKEISGVQNIEIDLKKALLKIEYSSPEIEQKIQSTINQSGYEFLGDESVSRNSIIDYLQIFMLFISMLILFWLFNSLELIKYFSLGDGNITIGVAFMIGIIASVSSCFAVIGGIILGFSNIYFEGNKSCKIGGICGIIRPNLFFHLGRFFAFFVLGGVLGFLGGKFQVSLGFTGFFTIIIGVLMFYIGLKILNLIPNFLSNFSIIPDSLSRKILDYSRKKNLMAPFIVGSLSFFLPCGFTQSMQLAALASGSFINGGLIMILFALGTFPVLFLTGIGAGFSKSRNIELLNKIIGVLVIVFGLYSLNSGLLLTGSNLAIVPYSSSSVESEVIKESKFSPLIQVVKMDINFVFEPTQFRIKKGIPVRWEINGIRVGSCSNEIVIPKLGIRQPMQRGLNIIEFTPQTSGDLVFTCGMGMLGGKFIVE